MGGSSGGLAAFDECSSKTFGFRFSKTDVWGSGAVCAVLIGAGFLELSDFPLSLRLLASCAGALCLFPAAVLFRMFVPLAMSVSFRGMVLIRRFFYVWLTLVLLSVGLSRPFFELFSGDAVRFVQVFLPMLTVLSSMVFFYRGNVGWSVAAHFLAGLSAGFSAFGILGWLAMVAMALTVRGIVFASNDYNGEWREAIPKPVVAYFTANPNLVRLHWVYTICNVAGVALAVGMNFCFYRAFADGGFSLEKWFSSTWLSGFVDPLTLASFCLLTVVPVLLTWRQARGASNHLRSLTGGDRLVFFVIGVLSVALLLFFEPIVRLLNLHIALDPRCMFVLQLACAYDLLVSIGVLYIDIRCRNCVREDGVIGPADAATKFSLTVLTTLPAVLLALALKFGFLSVLGTPLGAGGDSAADYPVVLRVTPSEALSVALKRGDLELAVPFARTVLQTDPQDPFANLAVGRLYLKRRRFMLAVTHLERAAVGLDGDAAVAEALAQAHSGVGNAVSAEKWRARAEQLKNQSNR